MLRKKTNGVARRPQRTSILSKVAESSVDRRAFLRGSGLAIGGLAAISATGGSVTKANAATAAAGAVETIKSVCTIVRSAVPSWQRCKTASGPVRNRDGTAPLTLVPIAPKAHLCANTPMANAV